MALIFLSMMASKYCSGKKTLKQSKKKRYDVVLVKEDCKTLCTPQCEEHSANRGLATTNAVNTISDDVRNIASAFLPPQTMERNTTEGTFSCFKLL